MEILLCVRSCPCVNECIQICVHLYMFVCLNVCVCVCACECLFLGWANSLSGQAYDGAISNSKGKLKRSACSVSQQLHYLEHHTRIHTLTHTYLLSSFILPLSFCHRHLLIYLSSVFFSTQLFLLDNPDSKLI